MTRGVLVICGMRKVSYGIKIVENYCRMTDEVRNAEFGISTSTTLMKMHS